MFNLCNHQRFSCGKSPLNEGMKDLSNQATLRAPESLFYSEDVINEFYDCKKTSVDGEITSFIALKTQTSTVLVQGLSPPLFTPVISPMISSISYG